MLTSAMRSTQTENFSKPTLIIKPTLSPGRSRVALYPGNLTWNLLDRATPNFNQIITTIISIDLHRRICQFRFLAVIMASLAAWKQPCSWKSALFGIMIIISRDWLPRDTPNPAPNLTKSQPKSIVSIPMGKKAEISFCLHSDVIDDLEML